MRRTNRAVILCLCGLSLLIVVLQLSRTKQPTDPPATVVQPEKRKTSHPPPGEDEGELSLPPFDERLPTAWNPQSGEWQQWQTNNTLRTLQDPITTIKVSTWNIWFDEWEQDTRFHCVMSTLKEHLVDIMAFQEVTDEFLLLLMEQPWIRDNFVVSSSLEKPLGTEYASYVVLMLVNKKLLTHQSITFREHFLTSAMGRSFLEVRLPMVVGTVHLESMKGYSHPRMAQLDMIFKILNNKYTKTNKQQPGTGSAPFQTFMGDFNFHSTWEENSVLDEHNTTFRDVWSYLRPHDPGYTEDTTVNLMRAKFHSSKKHVRFDRIIASINGQWKPIDINRLGVKPCSPYTPEVFGSDHFGLLVTYEATLPST
eukprot:TRINITY_DN33755_c0_g1_i1.p1 TRINITY_DN33755_c0_g1~~TRINITY_DN33755_c0_g1_i1.p1  ORF type:complete len:367 (-),score=14.02 TRINITY_DN33755_c0_g1_i1:118-1218(-)